MHRDENGPVETVDWEWVGAGRYRNQLDRAVTIIAAALAELPRGVCEDVVRDALAERMEMQDTLSVGEHAYVAGAEATVTSIRDDGVRVEATLSWTRRHPPKRGWWSPRNSSRQCQREDGNARGAAGARGRRRPFFTGGARRMRSISRRRTKTGERRSSLGRFRPTREDVRLARLWMTFENERCMTAGRSTRRFWTQNGRQTRHARWTSRWRNR